MKTLNYNLEFIQRAAVPPPSIPFARRLFGASAPEPGSAVLVAVLHGPHVQPCSTRLTEALVIGYRAAHAVFGRFDYHRIGTSFAVILPDRFAFCALGLGEQFRAELNHAADRSLLVEVSLGTDIATAQDASKADSIERAIRAATPPVPPCCGCLPPRQP